MDGTFFFWSVRPRTQRVIKVGALDGSEVKEIIRANSQPLYSRSGHLLFHRDGTLLAQPFDAATLAVSGEPVRVAEAIAFIPQFGPRSGNSFRITGFCVSQRHRLTSDTVSPGSTGAARVLGTWESRPSIVASDCLPTAGSSPCTSTRNQPGATSG